IAMDPPITLMISWSISQPLAAQPWRLESTCAANASWTSTSPRSRHAMPARSSALGTAKIGAWSSCQPGSTAATAYDRMKARGTVVAPRRPLVLRGAGDVVLLRHFFGRLPHRLAGRRLRDRRRDRHQVAGAKATEGAQPAAQRPRLARLHEHVGEPAGGEDWN